MDGPLAANDTHPHNEDGVARPGREALHDRHDAEVAAAGIVRRVLGQLDEEVREEADEVGDQRYEAEVLRAVMSE